MAAVNRFVKSHRTMVAVAAAFLTLTACTGRHSAVDKKVALELVSVLHYGAEPKLSPGDIEVGGARLEDYGPIVAKSIYLDADFEIRSMVADRYLVWARPHDSWAVLQPSLAKPKIDHFKVDLNVACAAILGSKEMAELSAARPKGDPSPLILMAAIGELAAGRSGPAVSGLLEINPLGAHGIKSLEFERRWLWYTSFTVRAAAAHGGSKDERIQDVRLAEVALECFLEGETWEAYLQTRSVRKESRLQTLCIEDAVWDVAGAAFICRENGNELAAAGWEKRLADWEELLTKEKSREADWVRHVRLHGFRPQ
jgi:hypothetical protein